MEAPKLPSLFKQNSAKPFGFKPRYYDARKERLEDMRRKYQEDKASGNGLSSNMKGEFRARMHQEWSSHRSKSNFNANLRLILILGLLFAIAWKMLDFFNLY